MSDDETTDQGDQMRVRLPENLGIKRCGDYVAGIVYTVSADEGRRLIQCKRFELFDGENANTDEV